MKSTLWNSSRTKLKKTHLSNNSIRNSTKNTWINDWPKKSMKNITQIHKMMIQVLTKTHIDWPENSTSMKSNLRSMRSIQWNSSNKKPKKMHLLSNNMKSSMKRMSIAIFNESSTMMATLIHKMMHHKTKATESQEICNSTKSNLLSTISTQSRSCRQKQNNNRNLRTSCNNSIKRTLTWK